MIEGTLTKNEQTVTEIYNVDEKILINSFVSHERLSPALLKTLHIGSICNNSRLNEDNIFVGQSTDVASMNVLSAFSLSDQRVVRV